MTGLLLADLEPDLTCPSPTRVASSDVNANAEDEREEKEGTSSVPPSVPSRFWRRNEGDMSSVGLARAEALVLFIRCSRALSPSTSTE